MNSAMVCCASRKTSCRLGEQCGEIAAQVFQMPREKLLVLGRDDDEHPVAAAQTLPEIMSHVPGERRFVSLL